jgi:transcriptional regulator with XRE-family HTH domain
MKRAIQAPPTGAEQKPAVQSERKGPRPQTAHLAEVIRSARKGRYTLAELSRLSGISIGMLSNIETGRGNPSYVSLVKLSKALGLQFSAFFAGETAGGEGLVRKGARPRLAYLEGSTAEVLSAGFKGPQVLLRLLLPPGYRPEAPFRHPGQSVLHLLSGSLVVAVGKRQYLLDEGDSLTWEGRIPHTFHNAGRLPVEAVIAVAPNPF